MTTTATRLGAASAGSLLALALAACGGNNDNNDRDGAPASEQSTAVPSDPSTATDDPGAAASAELVAAGRLVVSEVSGSTLTSIEQDDAGWEVTVTKDDGSTSEATTNAGGTTITQGPDDGDDDTDDRAENERETGAASLDFEAALSAITKAVPGSVRELNLDTRDGSSQVVWEADVRDSSGARVSVSVDAKTGAVVSKQNDD